MAMVKIPGTNEAVNPRYVTRVTSLGYTAKSWRSTRSSAPMPRTRLWVVSEASTVSIDTPAKIDEVLKLLKEAGHVDQPA